MQQEASEREEKVASQLERETCGAFLSVKSGAAVRNCVVEGRLDSWRHTPKTFRIGRNIKYPELSFRMIRSRSNSHHCLTDPV